MAAIRKRTGSADRRRSRNPAANESDRAAGTREVLLVDDDLEPRDTIRFGLESAGYLVTTFDNSPEAWTAMLALPELSSPRLLLLAINLPGLDGHTLHEQLQLARPQKFIVVFLSARDSDADKVRASAAGAVDYLVKPVSIPVLLAKVKVWFRLCDHFS